MQSSRFFPASTIVAYFYIDHGGGLSPPPSITVIPCGVPPPPGATVPILVHSPGAAAVKIQAAYHGHLVRSLVRRVRDADAEADHFERLIQTQKTVDAVRRDKREQLRVAEGLMALLLCVDGVPGFYPEVRELWRATNRQIVALQELHALTITIPPNLSSGVQLQELNLGRNQLSVEIPSYLYLDLITISFFCVTQPRQAPLVKSCSFRNPTDAVVVEPCRPLLLPLADRSTPLALFQLQLLPLLYSQRDEEDRRLGWTV